MASIVRVLTGAVVAGALLVTTSGCAPLSLLTGSGSGASATPAVDPNQDAAFPPQADVTLKTCAIANKVASVSGTVTNPTTKSSQYVVRVTVLGPKGAILDEVVADHMPALKTGATAKWTGTGTTEITGPVTCQVGEVDREQA